jgi:predicted nucleic acid-binding protein
VPQGAAGTERRLASGSLAIEQPTFDRALAVHAALAERSEHRGASLPALIIAAAAERAQITLLRYDRRRRPHRERHTAAGRLGRPRGSL